MNYPILCFLVTVKRPFDIIVSFVTHIHNKLIYKSYLEKENTKSLIFPFFQL